MAAKNTIWMTLGRGATRTPWERALPLALALQLRSAWVLLGVWLSLGGSRPLWQRFSALPAHPDWHLVALVQSLVTALAVVGLARRWRAGWVVAFSAIAGAVAWAVGFAYVPNGLQGFLLVFRPTQETFAMVIVLVTVASAWRWLGRWVGVPVAGLVGGVGAASIRLVFSHTIWGVPWPEGWQQELTLEVCGVTLLMATLAILRGTTWRGRPGTEDDTPRDRRLDVVVGLAGLLGAAVVQLSVGSWLSGWTWDDSSRLVWAAGVLAVATAATVIVAVQGGGLSGRRPQ